MWGSLTHAGFACQSCRSSPSQRHAGRPAALLLIVIGFLMLFHSLRPMDPKPQPLWGKSCALLHAVNFTDRFCYFYVFFFLFMHCSFNARVCQLLMVLNNWDTKAVSGSYIQAGGCTYHQMRYGLVNVTRYARNYNSPFETLLLMAYLFSPTSII